MKRRSQIFVAAATIMVALVVAGSYVTGQRRRGGEKRIVAVDRRNGDTRPPGHHDAGNVNQLPVGEYEIPNESDPKREAKARRYGAQFLGPIGPDSKSGSVVSYGHWWQGLSALPVAKSDAIVIGVVTGAQAHLTGDRRGIYSEFEVTIREVFKGVGLRPRDFVIADREGGAISLPNGNFVRYRVAKQGMPRVGAEYVLFLKATGSDHSIITGYEINEGRVSQLDGTNTALQFTRYSGTALSSFLGELKDVIEGEKK